MSEKRMLHFLAKHTCYFLHRQTSSAPVIIENSERTRIWFEYDDTEPTKRKSCLCIYRALEIKFSFLEELQKIARGETDDAGVVWKVDVSRKRGQRLELPSGLTEGCDACLAQISQDMHKRAECIVTTLRWRLDLYGPGRVFAKTDFLWSEDGKRWMSVPHTQSLIPEIQRDIIVENLNQDIFSLAMQPGRNEPIGHILFRDAWQYRSQDHKAALTQGVSALEVAVKHCITKLVPEAEYLVFEMPTPPVVNLLRIYLPALAKERSLNIPSLPTFVLESVRNMVHQRNMLVHKGELTADLPKVIEYLEIIRDLLYYLDFLAGNTWAITLTSEGFKRWIVSELPDLDVTDPLVLKSTPSEHE